MNCGMALHGSMSNESIVYEVLFVYVLSLALHGNWTAKGMSSSMTVTQAPDQQRFAGDRN